MHDVSFHLTLIKKLSAINAMLLFYTHYFESRMHWQLKFKSIIKFSFYRYDITISTNASDVIQYNNITPFIKINAIIRVSLFLLRSKRFIMLYFM